MAESEREVPGYPDEAPLIRYFNIPVPKIAAKAASTVVPAVIIPWNGTLFSATYASIAAIAESATEFAVYEVLTFNAKGEAVGAPAASLSTKETAAKKEKLEAHVAKALTLSATAANLVIEAGGFIELKVSGTEMKEDKAGILRIGLSRNVKETPKEQPGV